MKLSKKVLAFTVSVAICLSAFICGTGVAEASSGGVNLLSGSVPIQFSAAQGFTNLRDGDYKLYLRNFSIPFGQSNFYSYGYRPGDEETKSLWSSYLSKLTDGNDSSNGVGFRYVGDDGNETDNYDIVRNHWTGVIYQFDDTVNVDSIVIKTSNEKSGTVHIFVADTYANCFNNDYKVHEGANGATVSVSNVNKSGCYFAFFTQEKNFTVYEMSVYGTHNILTSGQIPVQYSGVSSMDNPKSNNRNLRYFPGGPGSYKYGYLPGNTTTKSDWSETLSLLTDGDGSTGPGLQMGQSGHGSDYMILAYQFDRAYCVSGFKMVSQNQALTSFDIYVADNYSDLFNAGSKVATVTRTPTLTYDFSSVVQGSYIAFVTVPTNGFTVYELEVYGYKAPSVEAHSVVLDDSIGLNFFMDLESLTAAEKAASYMTFDIPHGTAKTTEFDNTFRGTGGTYGFTCPLSSVQMAESVTPTLHYTTGGFAKTVVGEPYSVKDYIDYVNANGGNFSSTVVHLVNAIGNYGYYAQQYFTGKTFTALDAAYVISEYNSADSYNARKTYVTDKAITEHLSGIQNGTTSGKFQYNLNLDSTTSILVKFNTANVNFTVTKAGVSYEDKKNAYTANDCTLYILHLPISQLGDNIVVSGKVNGNDYSMEISGLTYVYGVLDNGDASTSLKNLACALCDYYTLAIAYANGIPITDYLSGDYM